MGRNRSLARSRKSLTSNDNLTRMDGTTLRVANIGSEADLELVRDALDSLGADYEYIDSEDFYPQTAYFQISTSLADDAEALLARLSETHGFDAEIL